MMLPVESAAEGRFFDGDGNLAAPGQESAQATDYPCRVPGGHAVGGNVARNDAAGTDDRAVADRDSGTEDRTAADPAVVADTDGDTPFDACSPFGGVERMVGREQLHAGADLAATTQSDRSQIEADATEIDEGSFASMEVVAVIAVERSADERSVDSGTKLAKGCSVGVVLLAELRVEAVGKPSRAVAVGSELRIARVEPRPGLHFLLFGHIVVFSGSCKGGSLCRYPHVPNHVQD